MWILLAMMSALLLGIYDVFKKKSLSDNAVIPVLSISIFFSFILFLPLLIASGLDGAKDNLGDFYIPDVDGATHFAIFLKSVIVLCSWICAYFGMKHIPITIFSPIRATQPIWTVLVAVVIFSEHLSPIQAVAIAITLISFFAFSQVGKKEGVSWKSNKWIWLVIAATVFGSASGLYDKHLMHSGYPRMAVQVYSTMYQSILMLIVMFALWYPHRLKSTPFQWRWTILGISVFLMMADYVYYWALSYDDAYISIVSTIRRSGAIVPFVYGAVALKEKNIKIKSVLLCGVILGVSLLYIFR